MMEEIVSVFVQEAREQLADMEAGLLRMEQGDHDEETLNAVFRAAHTIKGASGVAEIAMIEQFTHAVENALDLLRNGALAVSSGLISALLGCCDHLGALLGCVEAGEREPDAELLAAGVVRSEALRAFLAGTATEAAATAVTDLSPGTVHQEGGALAMSDCWHISIRFGRGVLRNGMDPVVLLRYLLSLGEIVHMTTVADALPEAKDMDPEACYLGFEMRFRSHATKDKIEAVFDFVRDDCELSILPPHSEVADYIALIEKLPEETMRLGEILVRSGALTQAELERGLATQTAGDDGAAGSVTPPIGEILVGQQNVQAEIVEAAVAKQKQIGDKKVSEARLIRVQADKLDQLIDLVGELVIAGASANLIAQRSKQAGLVEATSVLSRLVESIRDSALQLRMVQIGETFSKFNRVVRDVAKELNKDIELVISGGETELDKSVVEKIGDPLMHLVRNAMDHGIEAPDVRVARGKPARGRLELNAYHDSGSIVIEVVDDGGGLNKEKIHAKAIEKGLVQPGQVLSDQEVIDLVFAPGFSTADAVSNLSGRGVGMDVVHKNIQALRGTVEVQTESGLGSRFTIRLPLTLAIIDGFLTSVARAAYVIPLDMVVECIELTDLATDRHYLNLRGEVLPFVRLRELFEVAGDLPSRENVVVVQYAGRKAGIVVDHLLGEFQTVIKPLGTLFRHVRGIGGSTILGSGEVALILDVQALVSRCAAMETEVLAHSGRRGDTLNAIR